MKIEQLLSQTCMDVIEKSEDIMEALYTEDHGKTNVGLDCTNIPRGSATAEDVTRDLAAGAALEYEKLVNNLQHLDAASLETTLQPLYDGSPNKILSTAVAFSNIIATHQGIIEKCVENLLCYMKWILLDSNALLGNMYQLKKLTRNLGLDF